MTYSNPLPDSLPPPAHSLEHSSKATKAFAISASSSRLEPDEAKPKQPRKPQPAAAAGSFAYHTTWQQRTRELAEVKGVEL